MISNLPRALTAQLAKTEVMLFQMIEIDAFSLDRRHSRPPRTRACTLRPRRQPAKQQPAFRPSVATYSTTQVVSAGFHASEPGEQALPGIPSC